MVIVVVLVVVVIVAVIVIVVVVIGCMASVLVSGHDLSLRPSTVASPGQK